MKINGTYLSIDLKSWVMGTISKINNDVNWKLAWLKTYRELGGISTNSGEKSCPMNGAKILYQQGRIKGTNKPYKSPSLEEVWHNSKNGVYALLAIEQLTRKPNISHTELWPAIQNQIRMELGKEPAKSNQGATTVAYKLWHIGLIVQ